MKNCSIPFPLYSIPYQKKYILYQPLKPLALLVNASTVKLLSQPEKKKNLALNWEREKAFLQRMGFFAPNHLLPEEKKLPWKPEHCVLLLTERCNLACTYCYAEAGDFPSSTLPFQSARKAIDLVCKNALEQGKEKGKEPAQK